MPTSLPHDQVESLLPVLGYVATMVRDHGIVERDDLEILLLGSGVEGEQAIEETTLWATILGKARGITDPTRRETVQRALMLRGVPEAPAMLALATVTAPSSAHPLTVSVDHLDFGVLDSGVGATVEIMIGGGPGRLVAGSDAIHIEPDVFGVMPTVVTVGVEGLPGGMLLSSITVVTERESRDLAVMARWTARVDEPAAPATAPATPVQESSSLVTAGSLPPEQIGPVLLQVARVIAGKGYLSYDQVEQLLIAAGIDATARDVDAAKGWADILQQVHDAPTVEGKARGVTDLVGRGIPLTIAEQAITAVVVTAKPGTSAAATRNPAPPRPRQAMHRLVVALDGSGTHTDLAEAVRDAAPNATIQLRAGVHTLTAGIDIHQPVTIEGESRETTRVVLTKGRFALRYDGNGPFTLKKLETV